MDLNNGGIGNVQYPLVSDLDKSIARNYDVLLGTKDVTVFDEEDELQTSVGGKVSLRGSFLIDEEGIIRHSVINDLPLGRNIDEMIRTIDALAFHTTNGDVCPAGWKEGDIGMNPSHEGMKAYVAENAENL